MKIEDENYGKFGDLIPEINKLIEKSNKIQNELNEEILRPLDEKGSDFESVKSALHTKNEIFQIQNEIHERHKKLNNTVSALLKADFSSDISKLIHDVKFAMSCIKIMHLNYEHNLKKNTKKLLLSYVTDRLVKKSDEIRKRLTADIESLSGYETIDDHQLDQFLEQLDTDFSLKRVQKTLALQIIDGLNEKHRELDHEINNETGNFKGIIQNIETIHASYYKYLEGVKNLEIKKNSMTQITYSCDRCGKHQTKAPSALCDSCDELLEKQMNSNIKFDIVSLQDNEPMVVRFITPPYKTLGGNWFAGIIDRADENVKILAFNNELYRYIQQIVTSDPELSNPIDYDLNIVKRNDESNQDQIVSYHAPKELSQHNKNQLDEFREDLHQQLKGLCQPSKYIFEIAANDIAKKEDIDHFPGGDVMQYKAEKTIKQEIEVVPGGAVEMVAANKLKHCIDCGVFNEYAEPNQKDGSYKCYSCVKGY